MAENLVRNNFLMENKIRFNLMKACLKITIILPWTVKSLEDRLF